MSREKRVPLAGGSADTAGLVKNFRDSVLKMSQEELATKLEVTRVAVLRWESSASEPSAEKYIRLAKLAQERGQFEWDIRFWIRAGVNASVLRELVPEVEKSIGRYERQKSKPQPDKEVRLPLLEDSFFRGDHEGLRSRLNALAIETSGEVEFATFPSAAIPNRNSTFAVRALDDHMRFVFCKGDIVAVDISCGMGSAPFGTPRLKEECDGQIVAAYYRQTQRTLSWKPISESNSRTCGSLSRRTGSRSSPWKEAKKSSSRSIPSGRFLDV